MGDYAQSERASRNDNIKRKSRTNDNNSLSQACDSQRNFNPKTARNSIQTKTISIEKDYDDYESK